LFVLLFISFVEELKVVCTCLGKLPAVEREGFLRSGGDLWFRIGRRVPN